MKRFLLCFLTLLLFVSALVSCDDASKDVDEGSEKNPAEEVCEHDWADATCVDPKTCSACGVTEGEALGHAYGAWVTTKQPTENDEGSRQRTCSVCGDVAVETIPPKFAGGDIVIVG